MVSFRMLHAADLHLDSPFRGLSDVPRQIREVIRHSTFRALERLVELAISEHVDLVVFAGDVYDVEDRSIRAQLKFHQAVERLAEAGIRVFIAHGNHDPLSGKRMPWNPPEGVHIFPPNDPETVEFRNNKGELLAYVHGVSYATADVRDNLAAKFHVRDHRVANIGVLHTNIDGVPGHHNYAPGSRGQLIDSGIDYWALGHIHMRSVLHESPYIVYAGNTQGRSMKETGAKGCYIVDITDNQVSGLTFHATDAVRWMEVDVPVSETRNEYDVQDAIRQTAEKLRLQSDGRPCVARLVLTGRTPLHQQLLKTSLLDELVQEWNEQEVYDTERDASCPFVWIESCQLETGSEIHREAFLEQDSFIGDMLRIAASVQEDGDRLRQLKDTVSADLLRGRVGRHLRTLDLWSGDLDDPSRQQQWEKLLKKAEDWLLDMLVEGGDGR